MRVKDHVTLWVEATQSKSPTHGKLPYLMAVDIVVKEM